VKRCRRSRNGERFFFFFFSAAGARCRGASACRVCHTATDPPPPPAALLWRAQEHPGRAPIVWCWLPGSSPGTALAGSRDTQAHSREERAVVLSQLTKSRIFRRRQDSSEPSIA
jgi:hypothetical protein